MPPSLIEAKFNELIWRMSAIEEVSPELEMKLRIAFQEGVLKTADFLLKKLPPNLLHHDTE